MYSSLIPHPEAQKKLRKKDEKNAKIATLPRKLSNYQETSPIEKDIGISRMKRKVL